MVSGDVKQESMAQLQRGEKHFERTQMIVMDMVNQF